MSTNVKSRNGKTTIVDEGGGGGVSDTVYVIEPDGFHDGVFGATVTVVHVDPDSKYDDEVSGKIVLPTKDLALDVASALIKAAKEMS